MLHLLLEKGTKVNQTDRDGFTALHYVARREKVELAAILFERGASINGTRSNVLFPLDWAVDVNRPEMVNWLLQHGAKVNLTDKTVLLRACFCKDAQGVVSMILETPEGKALVNSADQEGNTPLHYAIQNGNIEMMKALIQAGAGINKQNKRGIDPLAGAVRTASSEAVELLVTRGARLDQRNFHQDCQAKGCEAIVKARLQAPGGKELVHAVDARGRQPLYCACEKGNAVVVQALIGAGADVKQPGMLNLAVDARSQESIRLLIQNGAPLEDVKISFHKACNMNACEPLVEAWLQGPKAKELANQADNYGRTPLYYACYARNVGTTQALIKAGADLNQPLVQGGMPPLQAMGQAGLREIVELLLKEGAVADPSWPLHGFCRRPGSLPLMKVLLQNPRGKAKINQADEYGKTPLYYACEAGNGELVSLLLEEGADVNQQADQGEGLLATAAEKGHGDIVKLLVARGARAHFSAETLERNPRIEEVFRAAVPSFVRLEFSGGVRFISGKELSDVDREVDAIAVAVLRNEPQVLSGLSDPQKEVLAHYRALFGEGPVEKEKLKAVRIACTYPLPSGDILIQAQAEGSSVPVEIAGHRLDDHTWVVGAKVGGGKYGEVSRIEELSKKTLSAVKLAQVRESHAVEDVRNERRLLLIVGGKRGLQGPPLRVITIRGREGYIADRLYDGDGKACPKLLHTLPPAERQKVLLELGADLWHGLAYLHAAGITHRDIKAGNVLVVCIEGKWHAVLADLGGAKVFSEMHPTLDPNKQHQSHAHRDVLTTTSSYAPDRDLTNLETTFTQVGTQPQAFRDACTAYDVCQIAFILEGWLSGSIEGGSNTPKTLRLKEVSHGTWKKVPVLENKKLDTVWEQRLLARKVPQGTVDLLRKCLNEDPSQRPKGTDMPALWEEAMK